MRGVIHRPEGVVDASREALVCGDTRFTLGELEQASDGVAGMLSARGIGPEDLVGIAMPRSADLLVAVLGVLKSGAAYLPLDPSFPADRLDFMIEDARPALVLRDLDDILPNPATAVTREPDAASGVTREPDAAAYVIYTSGSTGRPKGVVVTNRDLETFLHAVPLEAGERLLAVTTLSFDISVLELLGPLLAGGTVVLAEPEQVRDPELLSRLIRDERITALQATPSLWSALLTTGVDLTRVRALVGGEALPAALARALNERAASVTNLYGPTEVTVWATKDDVDGEWSGTIGHPLPGTTALVLDDRLNPVPPGVAGELYLGGAQVARGYLGRPALTASRFVATGSGRLYRTGDLARWRTDGRLEFLGRVDHQVKVRGFRIELEEIEAVALAHPPITHAVVVAREDRLVAYVVSADGTLPPFADTLPPYMVPSAVHVLDALPLTPNGKIDRAALPDLTAASTGTTPRSRTESAVAEIVASVLGVEPGVHDDLFALGAHSLTLVRLAADLRQALGAQVSVASLFAAPTVAGIARLLATGAPAGDPLAPVLTLAPGEGEPLFCLPPASGLTWQFAALKRYLPMPLIGLQSPTLSGLPAPASLAELAAEHADRIEALQPDGPIRLLGWSFGGALALVLAEELSARGRTVSWVGMLDTRRSTVTEPGVAALLAELGFEVPAGELTVDDAVALIRGSDDPVGVLTDAQIALVVENYLLSDRLLASASYPAYRGRVLFVNAELDGTASDGWADLPHLTVRSLPVAHSAMLDLPTLDRLGPLLAEA